ncbi:MAG: DUF1499 domain-containing protein [Sinobacteraceae bacterium]|nr:DUF1499 domain-containing protein [Nevskiaceae bacterium]
MFAFAIGLAWLAWAVLANRGEAARYGIIGFVGSIAILAVPLYDIYMALTSPAIHDISTDIENPPRFIALARIRSEGVRNPNDLTSPEYDGSKLARGPDGKTATTSALQKKYYGDIHPRADLTSPEKFFDRAVKTAYRMGWHVITIVPDQGRIEASDSSFWFGLTDDIAIRVRPSGQGVRLDIRSKSREDFGRTPFGPTDMGRNTRRIRSFLKTLTNTY